MTNEKPKRSRRGTGEGSISKVNGRDLWRARITVGRNSAGKVIRKVIYGKSRREVAEQLTRLQNQRLDGKLPTGGLTVGELLTRWLDFWVTGIADTTRKQYQRIADNHIRPSLGTVDLAKLTPLHVQRMLDSLASRGVRDRTRQYAFGTLRTALNAAIERDLLAVNPCKKSLKPKCKPKEGTALTQEQADRLIEASATGEWEAMIRLAIFSGMRQGELFALTWDDVDFSRSTVHVRHSLQEVDGVLTVKEPKSASGRRSIMIDSTTLGVLQDHRKRAIASGKAFSPLVFSDSHGGHLRKSNFNRKAWQPIKEAAGLESIRFHDLRHTHSTWLIEDGVPLRDVQGRVGHSTPHMTMRYVHRVKQAEDRAQAAMERRAAKNSCSPYVALNGEKADEKDAS